MTYQPLDGRPGLDPELCREVVGKRLLVGLTYVRPSGELIRQVQYHGTVVTITEEEGIVILLDDGTVRTLPPDLRGVQRAEPGTYTLRSSGEAVHNPDYLYTWTITRPDA